MSATIIEPTEWESGECVVVLLGHAYRCIIQKAQMDMPVDGLATMSVEYTVLGDAPLSQQQQQTIARAVAVAAPALGQRKIDLDDGD